MNSKPELEVEDFSFEGPLASEGAQITRRGRNRFKVVLGHAPKMPDRPNQLQFTIKRNAKGNRLSLDVHYEREGRAFNSYFVSWSYDLENWRPVHWETGFKGSGAITADSVHFPEFEQDVVHVGHQVPMSFEMLEQMLANWVARPGVESVVIGQSLGGRPIYRLRVNPVDTTPGKPLRHYVASQHGEHNAQWRMVGMIDWLLSDEGNHFRSGNICHFVVMVGPDGPSKGWQCVNAEGGDLQRWRADGDDGGPDDAGYGIQPHESWEVQKDFEAMMAREPLDTTWSMHTWQGVVEPMIIPGEWMEKRTSGTWEDLRAMTLKYDRKGLCKPLKLADIKPKVYKSWGHGPWQKYGMTSFGCEGAGGIYTKADNLESGRVLIRAFAEYCGRFAE